MRNRTVYSISSLCRFGAKVGREDIFVPTWRVFENRVLRRVFGPKREEVTGDWRKLHSEVVHNLYCSPNIVMASKSRTERWEGHIARIGEMRNTYKILIEKPEGKRPLQRPRHRWEGFIKMDST
jgi:hypothetical protein